MLTGRDRQIFIVSGSLSIGDELGRKLLSRLKTLRVVFGASVKELATVEGIGPIMAKKMVKVIDAYYEL